MNNANCTPRFPLGAVFATPGAIELLDSLGMIPHTLIARHVAGDWGALDDGDAAENERSVDAGLRIVSAYVLAGDRRVWIITEADRSVTTLLLPDEY